MMTKPKHILLSIVMLAAPLAQGSDEALLEPEQAFRFEVVGVEAGVIDAVWNIADGYYMYDQKYRFEIAEGSAEIGSAQLPEGAIKTDQYFGEMEIHEGLVPLTIDYRSAGGDIVLAAYGQGCNEPIGVCFPPLVHKVSLTLPPKSGLPATGGFSSTTSDLNSLLSGNQGFLDVDEAFRADVIATHTDRLLARFEVAPGYYLYQAKFRFVPGESGVAAEPAFPPGTDKHDEYFGQTVVYEQDVDIPIALVGAATGSLAMEVEYQGCADRGICYPPVTRQFVVTLPGVVGDAAAAQSTPSASSGGWLWIGYLATAFVTGLLLSFTPCVLPMIPIVSSVVVGQVGHSGSSRGGMLSIIYVLGTAVTYASIGAVAGATGDQLQAYFQTPLAIGTLSALLAVMALAMFGVINVQLPSGLQTSLANKTWSKGGGSIAMVFVLGLVSALIVGACVSPLLISALSVAIAEGDPVLGAAIMFTMALGMGVLLIAVGFGAGYLMPRVGPWMERVQQLFGALLLGVAIYLLGFIPEVPVLLLWAAWLIVIGVFLGATQALPVGTGGWRFLWKGIGMVMLVWGVAAFVGGLAGNRDVLNPIPQLASIGGVKSEHVDVKALIVRVGSVAEFERELARAGDAGKDVILDYYADWCVDCVRMERNTFADPQVSELLRTRFVLLQVDVTNPTDPDSSGLKDKFGVFGPPAMLFFVNGREVDGSRLYGYRSAQEFLEILNDLSAATLTDGKPGSPSGGQG